MNRVYVSSTYSDLAECRDKVYRALRQLRFDVIAMEDYVASDQRPLDKCLEDVRNSDAYVGIFAWRYGYIPPGQERCITELEYREARGAQIVCFIFLADKEAPWPRDHIETGPGAELLERLREKLEKEHMVQYFSSPDELARMVTTSLAMKKAQLLEEEMKHKQSLEDSDSGKILHRQRVVNTRPLDVSHFKGRTDEIKALHDFLSEESVRLISIAGRGGMGKTALACLIMRDLEQGNIPLPWGEGQGAVDGIIYLSGVSTGLGLHRVFSGMGRILGEPAASSLRGHWQNDRLPLAAKIQHLLSVTQNGHYFILMDNMEERLDAEGTIRDDELRLFVEQCAVRPGGIRLIITTRQRLKIIPAALPHSRDLALKDGLDPDSTVQFLRDMDPQGTMNLRDAPESELKHVAQLTHGIPRALEIVAGLLFEDPTLSLNTLVENKTIFGNTVMEKLLKSGYDHLEADARKIVECMSVFARPMDEVALRFLLHPWFPGIDVHTVMRRLVNSRFVNFNKGTGEYSLHPLDMEYAYNKIPN